MRSRLGIAAQAVGVAALGAIVYLAFLQPSSPHPLSGIEVEGDLPAGGAPDATNAGRARPAPRARGRDGRTARIAGIRLVPTSPGGVPPSLAINTDTPTGAQYQDSVARVLGQLARPQPAVQARQDRAP